MNDASQPVTTAAFGDDHISSALATLIRELGPGGKLPSERELSVQLGVSRSAVRDRLAVLVGLGTLERQSGSGTYVAQLQPGTLSLALHLGLHSAGLPLESLESVRIALERQAAKEACHVADPVLIAYMKQALITMSQTMDHEELLQVDRSFHQSLLRASQNPSLVFFADVLADILSQSLHERAVKLGRSIADDPSVRDMLVGYHQAIYDAIMRGDEHAAMHAIDAHFDALVLS